MSTAQTVSSQGIHDRALNGVTKPLIRTFLGSIALVRSMTGFARQGIETPEGELTLELRAVNHRYLDLQFKLPEELRAAEPALRTAIGGAVGRGKVECGIFLKRSRGERTQVNLNKSALQGALTLIAEAREAAGELGPVNPIELLRWPNVLEEPPIETTALTDTALGLLDQALDEFNRMRAREGERMKALILERVDNIAQIASDVAGRRTEVVAAAEQRIRSKIEALAVEVDSARLATEVAVLAQKLDVDEELDRLQSHLVEVRDVLASDEPVGRRLDFLMQELNREANTLASKAADAATTSASVDLKVFIEQMREQIQNVE